MHAAVILKDLIDMIVLLFKYPKKKKKCEDIRRKSNLNTRWFEIIMRAIATRGFSSFFFGLKSLDKNS